MKPGQQRKRVAELEDRVDWEDPAPPTELEAGWPQAAGADVDGLEYLETVDMDLCDTGPGWDFSDPGGDEVLPAAASESDFVQTVEEDPRRETPRQKRVSFDVRLIHRENAAGSLGEVSRSEEEPPAGASTDELGQMFLLPLETSANPGERPPRSRRSLRVPPLPEASQTELLFRADSAPGL